ncbi:Transketolase domain protein OS=Tsukamurella paurometabola (strain ATCC 8368 / DSM / CCUG 35730/ CIP 100753 / JCM 10117 / KCTC 9821 / NBRC 16120 / NCIMB 702349 / NCTC 13040) OX=521096 GN=Tpau_3950 PE=4 SV=1 [Tsukamurella paurometabola]|uniref:Transketolase domain protein n=1 Tax=Tsukamurella paurometabola (strain ATCC 8368 / DSM 20162 / CCUG 35730 / CIP 100753 / JCM 10117 / KCTC 9821 / NBRC 16120 / NCIMB 702349 / NCTC 13040) TaxID=521096 RepID=D5UMP8_TSUPD|nr:Transketolase domain protein [Tsukamurella paurometabola DSM 20162]SUP39956.1 Transketolase 2 [Tsukamurella paurometabola]
MIPPKQTPECESVRTRLEDRAKFVRLETVRLSRIAGAGHYTSSFSAAELFAALYYSVMNYLAAEPKWADRDRFVLSKGHAAIGLYPVLADVGFFPESALDDYTRLGSPFGDHPDMKKIPGIDFSSGSLGHGLSIAVGMALAGRVGARPYRTFCMLGDGELHEGQVWEAANAAGHYRLGKLVAIVDRNRLCIDGFTDDVMSVEPIEDRFAAFGWQAHRVDGHDVGALLDLFDALPDDPDGPPQVIVADTVKGRGVKLMEYNPDWHVGNLVGTDYDDVIAELQAGLRPLEVVK